jgi:glycosyltransferase involved in cell wall biosynthesis
LWFLWSKRKSYDIIHVHQALHAAVFSTVAAGLLGKRIIIKVGCGGPLSDLKMMKGCRVSPFGEFFWKIIKRCDRIVAINAEIEEELLNDGFARQQVVRIPNGIASLNVPTKSTYGIKASIRFVSVGRLDPQKGYDVLLTAINLLSQQVEFQFECNIFGGGKEATKLEELIEEYGLQETVFLRGIVNDVQDRLHRMDIFIQASRAEGLSNALMEAMAAGLPCIATKIGGNSDLLNPEGVGEKIPAGEFLVCENGILVNPDDEIGLKKAIVFLASADDNLRQTLGMRAGRWIREHCCLERVTDRYLELYEELLTAKRRTLC